MVDLEAATDLLYDVMYEPEQFPGLIYRLKVCAGGTSEKIIYIAVKRLYETLNGY